MTLRTQKIVSASLVAFAAAFSLEALLYIVNLNQVRIFLYTAFWVWVYMWFKITFLYDLHYKNISANTLAARFEHMFNGKTLREAINCLLLPGFIFWSTVVVLYIEQGNRSIQQTIIGLSLVALVLNFWYLKEVFSRKTEVVDEDIFVALSILKIYAATLLFGASMAIFRRFCLEPQLFTVGVFALSFLLVYQALYQHRRINATTIFWALCIGALQGTVGYFVYMHWAYNFFTAAVFLAVTYNLFWGVFHYYLDHALTKKAFVEILLFSILIASMIFGTTNFKARISGNCFGPTINSIR